jgi:hypothetical protein
MTMGQRLREALATNAESDPLADRVAALRRFARATEPHVPPEHLTEVWRVVGHADDRMGLSGEHTVVALAGATGSGKSSLFNTLARMDLSPIGVRRPTTALPYACVWGPGGSARLLDWLGGSPVSARWTPTTRLRCVA